MLSNIININHLLAFNNDGLSESKDFCPPPWNEVTNGLVRVNEKELSETRATSQIAFGSVDRSARRKSKRTHTHTQIEGNEHDQAFQWHIYTKTFKQMEMNEFGFASSRYGVSGWHIRKRQPKPNWITSQITAIIYFDFLCQMSSSAIFFSLQNIRYFLLVSSLVSSFSRGRYKYTQWICVCAESNIFLFVVGCYRFVASQWQ